MLTKHPYANDDARWTWFARLWEHLARKIYEDYRQTSGLHHSWCTCGVPPCVNA